MTEGRSDNPLVSIGLAVYNGEAYLETAISSILAQTYPHFELIISDNASTDRTAEICQRFAAADPRIRYSRNPTNIGGANNENLTFRLARGKYFRWAAHDDVCAPALLERCVAVLESRPDVVLCHSRVERIDEHGRPIDQIGGDKASAPRPSQRLASLTDFDHDCEATYGLMRAEVLAATGLQRNYTDSDRTLLAHVSLFGRFYEIPEVLFFKRVHPGMSTQQFSEWRQRMLWFGKVNEGKITLPYWAQLAHYLEIIAAAPISLSERLRCYAHMAAWVTKQRRWKSLVQDVLIAGEQLSEQWRARGLVKNVATKPEPSSKFAAGSQSQERG